MFNKAWYDQNRGTNIKSHAHTTEFHLQNVPPGGLYRPTPRGPTQACGLEGSRRRGRCGAERGEWRRVKTKNSPYKSSKRASQWYYHNDTGTNKNKNKKTQADKAGYAAKNLDGRPGRAIPRTDGQTASALPALPLPLSRSRTHSLARKHGRYCVWS